MKIVSLRSFFLNFVLYDVFIVKVQELACSATHGLKETLILTTAYFTCSEEKSVPEGPCDIGLTAHSASRNENLSVKTSAKKVFAPDG